jgi:glutathione S-transferase
MYKLYYYPGKACLAPHMLLEELGTPYELVLVDFPADGHKQPEYLKLNPAGRLPVLVDGDIVLYEAAAICLHLADRHPEAALAPALGTAERAHFYKWLIYLTNTLQTEILVYYYPTRLADSESGVQTVKHMAEQRIGAMLDIVEAALAENAAAGRGDYLLGAHYSAVDPYLLMLARWTRNFARPARARQHLGPYLERIAARPAIERAFRGENIETPFF